MTATICRLGPADHSALARLLKQSPVETAYLRSELRLWPTPAAWWGVGDGGELHAVFLGGSMIYPWIPNPGDARILLQAVQQHGMPRLLVGPAGSVHALAEELKPWRVPLSAHDPQPLLVLERDSAHLQPPVNSTEVRRAGRHDLDAVMLAAAGMHREEMGIDPLAVDPAGWRHRMTTLIDRGWSYVWRDENGEILFKAELSGWNPDVAQIQGVWTNPRLRGRGIATAGLTAVCTELLRDVPVCSLYVNAHNQTALSLYRRLGFRQIGEFATLVY